ncbi:fatty acid--CoA ligase family protein [Aneurinibacillus terranovensis]|uniref:fatty acid--CoA ligase family protein n=1 Tax=Aneurinibacillus terranovensis TaxID=278991 RepID=UPI0004031612|nr:fatty acid--CoA ligase family protein [Aneurinibacillus terranovensis]
MTLVDNLKNTTAAYPDTFAYLFLGDTCTYGEFFEQVKNAAAYLADLGIGKGDNVALLLGNSPHFVVSFYGTLLTGATVVPINPIYTPHEIEFILKNSGARVVFAVEQLLPVFENLKPQLPELEHVVFTSGQTPHDWTHPYDELSLRANRDWEGPLVQEEDVAVILYTSGTTGTPKGAMLTHRNLTSNAESIARYLKVDRSDRVVAVLPMFHVFCMTVCLNAAVVLGSTLVIIPRFSPGDVMKTIRETKATIFAGVPTMYNFLLHTPDGKPEDLSSLRVCISGGAALPVALMQSFEAKFNKVIYEGYGLSEASPVTAFNPVDGVRKPGSIGISIPDVESKIVDEEDLEVPLGQVGELVVRGPNVMKGYFRMPEETAMALRNGWLHTGDMARMDEDGYIFIVDRKKDMIIVGGFNVYPREVEEALYQHSSIVEAVVIGVPDENFGEAVHAYVVTKDHTLTEESIQEYCRGELAKYKVPHKVIFIEDLPKNTTGKIMRRVLRDQVMRG